MILVVSRHTATVDWVRAQGIDAEHVDHLTDQQIADLTVHDEVIGTLPMHLVADLTQRGVGYRHIVMDMAPEDRGTELTVTQMQEAGARLVPYRAYQPGAKPDGFIRPAPPGARGWGRGLATFMAGFSAVALLAFLLDLSWEMFSPILRPALTGTPETGGHAGLGLLAFILAALVGYGLWRAKGRILQVSMYHRNMVTPKRVVIQGLSTILDGPTGPRVAPEALVEALKKGKSLPLDEWLLDSDSFKARHSFKSQPLMPWQQNLRSANAHRGRLEYIIVVPSGGERGSDSQVETFREFAESRFADDGCRLSVAAAPVPAPDYEDHEQVRRALRAAIRMARDLYGVAPDDIAVDVTAGTKVFSVTGAAVTFNHDLTLTYVNNAGQVREYDASVALGDFG